MDRLVQLRYSTYLPMHDFPQRQVCMYLTRPENRLGPSW